MQLDDDFPFGVGLRYVPGPASLHLFGCGLTLAFVVFAAAFGGALASFSTLAAAWIVICALPDPRRRERAGETICEFARSFPRRTVDPWVVRAIWEAAVGRGDTPIRADDRFVDAIDDEDFFSDFDGFARAVRRDPKCLHSLDESVKTVDDFVRWMSSVPRVDGLTWAR